MTNRKFHHLAHPQPPVTSPAGTTSQPRFIRITALASTAKRSGRLPLSPASIWRLARLGEFPKPIKLSEAITAWRIEDIENWEAARCAESNLGKGVA